MKRILLASASIVAFAGAAKADFDISGTASIGWNDRFLESEGNEAGFYNDLDFDLNFSQELDYGVTAAARIGFEYVDSDGDSINNGTTDFGAFTDDNFLLSLTADMGGLYFGHTEFAAETYWDGVSNMEFDNFSEADGETVLRGEFVYGDITTGVSYVIHNDDFAAGDAGTGNLDQMSLGGVGTVGAFTFSFGYQEEADELFDGNGDFNPHQVWGASVGATYFGADIELAYADNDGVGSSTGIEATYPVGPVALTAFYVMNNADDDAADVEDNWGVEAAYAQGPFAVAARYHDGEDEETAVEGSYELGNGLTFFAGWIDERENGSDVQGANLYYVAAEADLGGGASLLVSYADADEEDDIQSDLDEIGANDYNLGTTVLLSLDF